MKTNFLGLGSDCFALLSVRTLKSGDYMPQMVITRIMTKIYSLKQAAASAGAIRKAKVGDLMYAIDASNSRDYNFETVVNALQKEAQAAIVL